MFMFAIVAACGAGAILAAAPQAPAIFPVADVRPGMVGIGRTVFAGDTIEDFQVHILGVVSNVTGASRDLVLARLEGGPLAKTGVIQGMSGSPVYIDGRLLGAVSYALGSFPKEPIAGITPIAEMTAAVNSTAPRGTTGDLALQWPAAPVEVLAAIGRLAERAAAPLGRLAPGSRLQGAASLADLAPSLRPIGAAMVFSGFDPDVARDLRGTLGAAASAQTPGATTGANGTSTGLRPGDPIGMALIRGDLEMGATGTVTSVEGGRVYAFGHPFLNLGPTSLAMTKAHVYTVVPSLDSSLKIASLGPVIGTMTQDRATAVGGVLGAGPSELIVNLTLASSHAPERKVQFKVLHDQALTPLFTYVGLLNAITSYERQSGALTIETSGQVSFGDASVTIDDIFTGDGAAGAAAAGATASVGMAATNEFKMALAQRIDLTVRASERVEATTIERAWLDTTRPMAGATCTLQVLLRDYRGATETIAMPITMPSQPGTVTLLISDAPTLVSLEDRELRPGRATSWPDLLNRMNAARRNNRVYVRLITAGPGTVIAGTPLPGLPASVRTVFDDDKTASATPVTKMVAGSWEQRLTRVVRGSRELTITVVAAR